jgi:hypothetical protein
LQPATIRAATGGGARVELHHGEHGVAAGQACVLYADTGPRSRVLGGGWIVGPSGAYNLEGRSRGGAGLSPAPVSGPADRTGTQGKLRSGRT